MSLNELLGDSGLSGEGFILARNGRGRTGNKEQHGSCVHSLVFMQSTMNEIVFGGNAR